MTITPMPVLPPATRGGSTRSADAKASAADDFAAVLDGQLAGAQATGSEAAGAKAPAAQPDDVTPSVEVAPDAALEAMLAGTVAVPVSPVAGPATTAQTGVATVSGDAVAAVPEAASAVPGATTAPTDGAAATDGTAADAGDARPNLGAPARPEPAPGEADAHPGATSQQPVAGTGAQPGVPVDGNGPTLAPDAPAAAIPATAEPAETDTSTATPGAVTAPAPAVVDVTPAGPAAPPVPSSPVLAQVTPALARVVTRGDGEHRMMLKLHPADLGEVHLTVTVRGDHVDVEIAAGAAARDVLREGSAHLRSLLESIGRSTGQLVLRDLPVTPTNAAGPGSSVGQDSGAGTSYADTGAGRRDQPDTRGGRRQPPAADQTLDRPLVTPRASGRTNVPGASALDVTV